MITELYELISEKDNKLPYYNKYGFLMAEQYSEQILKAYCERVNIVAEHARNRVNYDELIRYPKWMQQYDGGGKMVQDLCRKWIGKYPTRKVMVQELRKIL